MIGNAASDDSGKTGRALMMHVESRYGMAQATQSLQLNGSAKRYAQDYMFPGSVS